jgi:sensor histidine kinase YesM
MKLIRTFGYTGLFCIAIGLGIWLIDDDVSLGVSFCIGWSINLAFVGLDRVLIPIFGPYLVPIPITAIGLAMGLLLAGSLVVGSPLFFFTGNYFTLSAGVFSGIVGFLIFSTRERFRQAQAELAQANAETARQERLVNETELKLLQAQIEPHFLFNTLSNIASLIHKDPDTAEKTLLNLTTLLRATLDRTRSQITTLRQELQIAVAYLDIQATRMHGRLTYAIDEYQTPGLDMGDLALPPLIVQPLIENAVKHGIEPKEAGGHINVRVTKNDTTLTIAVEDNGQGIPATGAVRDDRTGLQNVRDRLSALYDSAALTIIEPPGGGVHAVISIPLSEPDQ